MTRIVTPDAMAVARRENIRLKTLLRMSVKHHLSLIRWVPDAANDDFDWLMA